MDNIEAYENLANAIVLSAVEDYRNALRKLSHGRKNADAEATKVECEQFFRSQWYELLTSVDGEMLIRKLNEEVND